MPDTNQYANLIPDSIEAASAIRIALVILAAGFLAITFLQSALDKVFDYKGNLSFMKEQFSKTFLSNMIGFFLPIILICELITGITCVIGAIQIARGIDIYIVAFGFLFSGMTLLMLLFGQRISKQYAGAVSLTGYFIIVLFGLIALSMH
ncbi:hypothetical protein BH09BAC5_BH09BAC5_14470 [soil metagenome]